MRWIAALFAPVLATTAFAAPPRTAEATLRWHLAGAEGVSKAGGFEAGFLKLDADNQMLFDGLDVLDSDPVCQCQDGGGHYRIAGHAEGADRYVATVNFVGEQRTWQVVMRKIGTAWQFYDVIDKRGSIRARLERHNACARAKRARKLAVDPCAEI